MAKIQSIQEIDIKNRPVFIRLDLNVPLEKKDDQWVIIDDNRIQQALPTIRYAVEQEAQVVLASHLGRPKGQRNPDLSLEPVAVRLAELLEQEVTLTDDCIGEGIKLSVRNLKNGDILLLENLRFHPGEEKNDVDFTHQLEELCDVYINDAFGTAHRKHASTYGLPALIENRGIGLLMQKEIEFLQSLVKNPAKPFYTILGGAKVSDKIKTIENLLLHVDGLLVGGAMAYAFMAALKRDLPPNAKVPSEDDIRCAGRISRLAEKNEVPILLPLDTIDSFDIGPSTIRRFSEFVQNAKTIFWNGPLGWFEKPDYAQGTFELAKAVSELECLKIVGGGDTVAAIIQSGHSENFDHLSTGGGAVLEYLEDGTLPGIDVLKVRNQHES